MLIYIIIITIVLLSAIGIIFITCYNKFQYAIIKIDEAENNMDLLLQKKYDLFLRLFPLIKEVDDKNEELTLEKLEKVKDGKYNNFVVHQKLADLTHKMHLFLDQFPKLEDDESIVDIEESLDLVEEEIQAAIYYYNDNVTVYNKLIHLFPSNIIRIFFHYQQKEFYSNEKKEIYEILKK